MRAIWKEGQIRKEFFFPPCVKKKKKKTVLNNDGFNKLQVFYLVLQKGSTPCARGTLLNHSGLFDV